MMIERVQEFLIYTFVDKINIVSTIWNHEKIICVISNTVIFAPFLDMTYICICCI